MSLSRSSPPPLSTLSLLPTLLVPLGCDWVDATGRQPGAEPVSPGVTLAPPPVEEEPSAADFAPLVLLERTAREVRLPEPDARLSGWSWHLSAELGESVACAAFEGFDATLAERSLADACTSPDDCALEVEETRTDGATRFRLRLPTLRAPFAARVTLSARDADGREIERLGALCGLSVNEAPRARDDRYTVAPGETLEIRADGERDLLANDLDDVDVRNRPLAIDPRPLRAPSHAERFELGADGGFVYRPRTGLSLGDDGRLEDGFAYAVSDGQHRVTAEVVVVIARENRPPREREPLPDLELVADPRDPAPVEIDLARFFDDPDGDALAFELAAGSLPPSGNLALTSGGLLVGRPETDDVGLWQLALEVSDGRETIRRESLLSIVRARDANAPPTATDIANVTVGGRFVYDVAPFFDDADGDRLRFSARGLPASVEIDEDGVIEGRSRKKNRGRWIVVVAAEDGRGGRVEDGFRLTIE